MKYYVVELLGHYEGVNPSLDWKSAYYSHVLHPKKEYALKELEKAKKRFNKVGL